MNPLHPPQPPQPPLPLSAQFENSVEQKITGAAPQTTPWKLSRCSDGKSIVDYGNKSVITDPQAKQTITLDHIKKEAFIMPHLPGQPNLQGLMPGMPQVPSMKAPSPNIPMDVKDLGKKMIAGHEAVGKLFTFHPPQVPKMPGINMPKMPGASTPPAPGAQAPQMPGAQPPQAPGASAAQILGVKPPQIPGVNLPQMPKLPQMPQPPGGAPPQPGSMPGAPNVQPPAMPHTMEVWTSPQLHLPLLTKTNSGATQQTMTCKQVTQGEPPNCAFKIPAGYKIVQPPSMPKLPASPIKL